MARRLLLLLLLPWLAGRAQAQLSNTSVFGSPLEAARALQSPSQPQASRQMLRLITISPTIPVDSGGVIKAEPDSATQRLYARYKVRTVVKVRLGRKGEVRDTLEYQTVDEQGRRLSVGTSPRTVERQWSYDRSGRCTSLIEFPTSTRQFTVITTYNPALRWGRQEILQLTGEQSIVNERQRYQHGDTLLTEIKALGLRVEPYVYPNYHQRSIRLVVHPDTVLVLTCFYDRHEAPSGYQANYLLLQQGKLREYGKLRLLTPVNTRKTKLPANHLTMGFASQMLMTLRQGSRGMQPQHRRHYDAQNQLTLQEFFNVDGSQRSSLQTVTHYTYNNLGQLIGQQMSLNRSRAALRSMYTVYSYLPTGLLQGETTDAQGAKPTFYRYLYQYYP